MHIRKIERKDLPAYGEVVARAMWDDEVINIVSPFRNEYPDSNIRFCIHRAIARYYRGEFMFVAVTDPSDPDWTGEEVIMGYASYATTVKTAPVVYPAGWLGNAFEQWAVELYSTYMAWFRTNRSSDPVAEQTFRTAAAGSHKFNSYFETIPEHHKRTKGDQHWELELLGVHPNFRRRGVGKALLQWGFDRATEDQVPLVLLASLTGEKLYLQTGFREIERQVMTFQNKHNKKAKTDDKDLVPAQPVDAEGITYSWARMAWEPPNYRDGEETKAES